jgi:hypothetical protein
VTASPTSHARASRMEVRPAAARWRTLVVEPGLRPRVV